MARTVVTAASNQPGRPRYEVADIFRRYGPEYRRTHRLPLHHHQVMNAIERCRTAALGGHVDACDACGHQRISYNSCRNRHCPKCQGQARAQWVAARQAELLPIEYFHVVFTMPEQINALLRWNQRLLLNLLFKAVSETLLAFGQRHLGGEIGITAVLHTWGQALMEHPHLHCIVTGGALATDGSRFARCPPGYLFPVRALAQVYRGKYCASLQRAYNRGLLAGGTVLPMLASPARFAQYLRELRAQAWVVYAKRPFAGPEQVIGYIGRYTHRVAISNQRIVAMDDGRVSFQWKDYREDGKQKVMTLEASEFIRRFLLHILPPAFVRIRHYGLLANGRRSGKLARCRDLLGQCMPEVDVEDAVGLQAVAWLAEVERCEQCSIGRMVRRQVVPRCCGPPSANQWWQMA
jgi:hypothetical protein